MKGVSGLHYILDQAVERVLQGRVTQLVQEVKYLLEVNQKTLITTASTILFGQVVDDWDALPELDRNVKIVN